MSLTKIELDALTDATLFDNTEQAVEASAVNALIKQVTNSAHIKTAGTEGRVFFQKTGELGQSANFFWNDTTSRLSLGMGDSPSAVLDMKAQGALSTDIAVRVRNSIDNRNIIEVQGIEKTIINAGQYANFQFYKDGNDAPELILKTSGSSTLSVGSDYDSTNLYTGSLKLFNFSNVLQTNIKAIGTSYFAHATANLVLGGSSVGTSATKTFSIFSGVAPTTSPVDAFQTYSADIVAGNAAPHFRTENGSIIKLYQETTMVGSATTPGGIGTPITDDQTFDGYTVAQAIKHLRNIGLLA